jgi:hypothetical protein
MQLSGISIDLQRSAGYLANARRIIAGARRSNHAQG